MTLSTTPSVFSTSLKYLPFSFHGTLLCSCVCRYLSLDYAFQRSSIADESHTDLRTKAVSVLASRLSHISSQTMSGPQLARWVANWLLANSIAHALLSLQSLAVQYLSKFSEFLPSLSCAHLLVKLLVAICKATKSGRDLQKEISKKELASRGYSYLM